MAVQDTSEEYNRLLPQQQKCRTCYDGEQAVHDAGKVYLPGLESGSDQNSESYYESYKSRAYFYNTLSRSIQFFAGLILKKGVQCSDKVKIEEYLKDVDGEGTTFYGFADLVVNEVLKVGFGGILVEHDYVPEEIVTSKELKESGYRSKLKWYPAESIIHTRNNIRLLEDEYINKDEFDDSTERQIRVLDLDSEGYYRQRVFKEEKDNKGKKTNEWVQSGDDIYPMINNTKLTEIPFYPCNYDRNSLNPSKPPLIDLADASIHHYGVYADYRNGVHFTGFPQLYISGKQDEKKEYRLGSSVAWGFEDSSASVKYAEFNGKGLEHPERLLTRLEMYMSKLGARMLMSDQKKVESAEKANIDANSESATLSLISRNCSEALTKALNMYLRWNNSEVISNVELNNDFDFGQLQPATLIALMKGVQAGLLTKEVFLYNVKKGELVPEDKSVDQLISDVEEWEVELAKKIKEESNSNDPLSERNKDDFKDPTDELRDGSRKKTDYEIENK